MITQKWIQDLMAYICLIRDQYDKLIIKCSMNDDEKLLSHLSCLTEEVWELAAEIRKYTKTSFSQKKVDAFKKEDLEDEIVDCLFYILYIAKDVWIENLDQLIERKIQKNKDRWYWIDK